MTSFYDRFYAAPALPPSGGFDWVDMTDQGLPSTVQDPSGTLAAPVSQAGTTITVPLNKRFGASWNSSLVLSWGFAPGMDDGAGNFKSGMLVLWLQNLDANLDATDLQITVGSAQTGPAGGFRHYNSGVIRTATANTGNASLGSINFTATNGRDAFVSLCTGANLMTSTVSLWQSGVTPGDTLRSQQESGHQAGADGMALVVGSWAASAGTVTANLRIRYLWIPAT